MLTPEQARDMQLMIARNFRTECLPPLVADKLLMVREHDGVDAFDRIVCALVVTIGEIVAAEYGPAGMIRGLVGLLEEVNQRRATLN